MGGSFVARVLRIRLSPARAYYYFYERSRGIVLASRGGSKGLSTLESVLAGLIAGSATTIISNPVWVVQTTQAVRGVHQPSDTSTPSVPPVKQRMGLFETVDHIMRKDGISAFWRGIGPALVLVANPVLQYTVFEQLKNILVKRRTTLLRRPGSAAATAVLTDWDYFLLGALSKLGECCTRFVLNVPDVSVVATSITYPYMSAYSSCS